MWEFLVAGAENELHVQQSIYTTTTLCVLVMALINFICFQVQIVPYCGEKGVYPLKKRLRFWQINFPVTSRLIHSPTAWNPFVVMIEKFAGMNKALRLQGTVSILATVGAIWFLFQENACAPLVSLLWVVWFIHVSLSEIAFLVFPWHSLMNETLLLIAISFTPLAFGQTEIGVLPSLCIRMLVFRVLFGFGKMKFSGAKPEDILYIKGFMVSVPLPGPTGWYMYRYLPDIVFKISYRLFFVSEMIVPFFYFAPFPQVRAFAAVFTIGLMVGIQTTANFGNFNALTAVLCIPVCLPLFSHETSVPFLYDPSSLVQTVCNVCLLSLLVLGIGCIPFNSWVQYSWHCWPSLRVAAKPVAWFCWFYEVLTDWRVVHAYGIFPPNTFAPQRQVFVIQGSKDGTNWSEFQYRFQPTQAHHRPPLIPLLHFFVDIGIFYQVTSGFMRSALALMEPTCNMQCRLVDNIVRNLLEGGDAFQLLSPHPLFNETRPPKYVRVIQRMLVPVGPDVLHKPTKTTGWWYVYDGQVEVPVTTLKTLYRIPHAIVDNLSQLDYSNRVWRQRRVGAQDLDLWERTTSSQDERIDFIVKKLRAEVGNLSRAAVNIIKSVSNCKDLSRAVEISDSRRETPSNYIDDSEACDEINLVASEAADGFFGCGYPFSGEHPNKDRTPTSAFQTYLFVLWLMRSDIFATNGSGDSSSTERLQLSPQELRTKILDMYKPEKQKFAVDNKDGSEIHDGLVLFATMYARIIRIEASLFRRSIASGVMKPETLADKVGDALLPGWGMYWRSVIQTQIPFSWSKAAEGEFSNDSYSGENVEVQFPWKNHGNWWHSFDEPLCTQQGK